MHSHLRPLALAPFALLVAACGSDRAEPAPQPSAASAETGTAADCPTQATWTSREILRSGPVLFAFAPDAIDANGNVRAERSAEVNGYFVKVPLNILTRPGSQVAVYGHLLGSDVRAQFTYGRPTGFAEEVVFVPRVSEQRPDAVFAPGSWLLPEPGCYQVFVEVDGHREGPFGVTIVASGT